MNRSVSHVLKIYLEAHNGFGLHQDQVSYSHRTTAFKVRHMPNPAHPPNMPSTVDSTDPLRKVKAMSVSVLLCRTATLQVCGCIHQNAPIVPLLANFHESQISNSCMGDNGGRYYVLFGVDWRYYMAVQVS